MFFTNIYFPPKELGRPSATEQSPTTYRDNAEYTLFPVDAAGEVVNFQINLKTTDTDFEFIVDRNDAANYAFWSQQGSSGSVTGNAGSPRLFVDGVEVSVADRNDVYQAIADGAWHRVEVINLDLSVWTTPALFGFNTSSQFNGDARYYKLDIGPTGQWDYEEPLGTERDNISKTSGFSFRNCP